MQAYIRYYNDNDINSWANATLTSEELAQFHTAITANNNLWQSYTEQGLYTIQNVYETVHSTVLESDIEVIVGQKLIMSPGVTFDSLTLDASYVGWLNRYNTETGGDTLVPLVQ
jgi:LPS sulfotransferase NodH